MVGSESRYGAFLEARDSDGLRRDLTPVEAGDARTIRIGGHMPVVDSISAASLAQLLHARGSEAREPARLR